MKFQKIGLISAAAALASLVSAGAYTQPAAPHIPTPVGDEDGHAFYIGGAISGLGGYAQNQSYMSAVYSGDANGSTTGSASLVNGAAVFSTNDVTAVTSLKFGGEAHLGAYFGVSEGYGVSLEAFGVTRTSFNPVSLTTYQNADATGSTAVVLNSTPGTSSSNPNADQITVGLNVQPQGIGYGVRLMPTVMLSEQFGMYASVGYGSQKWQGTLTNSVFFQAANQYSSSPYQVGTLNAEGQAFTKNLSGINYGLGSVFNIDETISVYTSMEVQKFGSYAQNAPAAVIDSVAGQTITRTSTTSTSIAASLTDNGTTAAPSAINLQINTYSLGIDYAFA